MSTESFPNIPVIPYNPNADAHEVLVFRHYNPDEVLHGRSMKDWLRFSVCYWHTWRGKGVDVFGSPTICRPWDDESGSMDNARRIMKTHFEFLRKLSIPYYTFHDRDIAPEGKTLEQTHHNLDEMVAYAKQLQQETGIKLLWGTANLFSHPRYKDGAATNPNVHIFAYAATQVQKAMRVTHELGGENFVFWGGREGYATLLNTDVKRELDHLAAFFRMAVDFKQRIGFKGQLLIEPKPKEPTAHQYDYDAQTVIGFLKTYALDKDFKLNIEPNHTTMAGHSYAHDVEMASKYGFLGSIDANTGDSSLGWDTDQFPMNLKDCALLMKVVIAQGGIQPGGLNFDCKVRRESTDVEDLFIGHIGAMDTFAKALRRMLDLHASQSLEQLKSQRYSSFDTEELGRRIEQGLATFEECEEFIKKHNAPRCSDSAKQEKFECIFNNFLHK